MTKGHVQTPQAREPLGHEMGDAPPGQVTSHESTPSAQKTRQAPRHSTTQLLTFVQLMVLSAPARTWEVSVSYEL